MPDNLSNGESSVTSGSSSNKSSGNYNARYTTSKSFFE